MFIRSVGQNWHLGADPHPRNRCSDPDSTELDHVHVHLVLGVRDLLLRHFIDAHSPRDEPGGSQGEGLYQPYAPVLRHLGIGEGELERGVRLGAAHHADLEFGSDDEGDVARLQLQRGEHLDRHRGGARGARAETRNCRHCGFSELKTCAI